MKKIKLSLLTLACLASVSLAAVYQLSVGYGRQITATSTPQEITCTQYGESASAQSLSLLNNGEATVFCAVNCTMPVFTNMMNNGIAIPVPRNMSYTFTGSKFSSVWIQTTNGMANVCVAAF
jgi:TPP-dependent pyruvate/acetoin dehydrogenase alpha subunit